MEVFTLWYFIFDSLIILLGSEFEELMGDDGAILFSRDWRVDGFRGGEGSTGKLLTPRLASALYGSGPEFISGQSRNMMAWQMP